MDKNTKKTNIDGEEKDIKDEAQPSVADISDDDELDALREQVEAYESKYKRALADYQNLQKRVQEEKTDWIRAANKDVLLRFLPVLDTLILANKHLENDGLAASIQQFLDVLKAEGVTRIETGKKAFDPHLMECIAVGEGEDNQVVEEIRAGYMQYDKVLRPAQVKVGQKK